MAFAGLKKQINKANQYVTEKMGGAEGTKLDLDFMEMERKTDVTVELVEELQTKTKEYLQPNPTARAKMAAVKGISKLSGQAKTNTYPQPEGLLADCMLTYGKKLGEDSIFAQALIEFGESLRQMADVKYSLDDNIKQNFLEPLHHLQTKDLKEVMHHRKKLQGRRLDFDCKRRRQAKDDEIRSAEDKFAESLQLAQVGMYNLLENDVEQVSQLVTFAEGLLEFHSQCSEILKVLTETLQQKREEAEERPKPEFTPKSLSELNIDAGITSTSYAQQQQQHAQGTNGGANRHGLIRNKENNGFGGMIGIFDNGGGPINHTNFTQNNNRHYPNPSRLKSNQTTMTSNSHHQFIYSSQQNLSTINNNHNNTNSNTNNNSNNNNNVITNNSTKNSNFSRNRVYGSYQSLTKTATTTAKINNNNQKLSSSTSNSPNIEQLGSHNYDLNSIDWLNAWNNPPPNIPSAAATNSTTLSNININNDINNRQNTSNIHFNSSNFTSSNSNNIHSNNNNRVTNLINNYSRTNNINSRLQNDPWKVVVQKPTHLELDNGHTPSRSVNASPLPSPMRSPAKTPATNRAPCCTALYDFEPENPGELGFKENDVIQLLNKVDENWFEGSVNGRTGYFPQSYVEINVPLPN